MGADLSVPMLAPLSVDAVVEMVGGELRQLLNWSKPLPVQVTRTQRFIGSERPVPTTVLDATDGPPEVFTSVDLVVEGMGRTDIICMTYGGEDDALHALLTSFGKGYFIPDLVFGVACAIAFARLSQRAVENDTYILGFNGDVDGDTLFEAFRCHHSHAKVEDAVTETLSLIEARCRIAYPHHYKIAEGDG